MSPRPPPTPADAASRSVQLALARSLLGAVLITMIRNGMNLMEISQFKQMMAIGAVVIIAVWIDVIRRQHLLKK